MLNEICFLATFSNYGERLNILQKQNRGIATRYRQLHAYVFVKGGNEDESIIKKTEKLLTNSKRKQRRQKKKAFTSIPGKPRFSMDYLH